MSAASGPARIAASEQSPESAPTACPECGSAFVRTHPRQLFCRPEHKRSWEARSRLRGLQLLPFAVAARVTRGGTRGKAATGARAQADQDMLVARWRDEDADAGRMAAIDFLELRYRLGFDRP